jgi:predicted kinase
MNKVEFLKDLKITEPTVILMQGLPGSGKSTLAKEIVTQCKETQDVLAWGPVTCSADDFWIQEDGTYKFDKDKVPENHYTCMRKFSRNLGLASPIIVDNTNTTLHEMMPYIKFGQAFGYKVLVVLLNVSEDVARKRNTHNVPAKTISGMFRKLQHTENDLRQNVKEIGITYFCVDQ